MSNDTPEPTELIYTPNDSWAPILIALGVAVAMVALWSHWWWGVIGAAILLSGVVSWWRHSNDEISRMRRAQDLGTAVIPAEPIRRSN